MAPSHEAAAGFLALGADAVTLLSWRDRAPIGRALSGFRVEHCGDADGALRALRHTGAAALVIGVTENAHEIVAAVLRRMRRGARSLRVAGVHDASRVVPSADDEDHALFSRVYLIDGTQLGIESHLVRFVARARPKARLRDIASDVANEVSSDPSDQRITSFFVEHGDENRTIAYAAECLDRSVTTLEADVQRICGLDAHELRTWGRLIAAALLLQGTLWSAERIGVELGFGGGSGLATRFREYAGVTPTSVRRAAEELVWRKFVSACEAAKARNFRH